MWVVFELGCRGKDVVCVVGCWDVGVKMGVRKVGV